MAAPVTRAPLTPGITAHIVAQVVIEIVANISVPSHTVLEAINTGQVAHA
jgi:hypothetical protein